MFDLLLQLNGSGLNQIQTKPENAAQGNGDAPDNAVFGEFGSILEKAQLDKGQKDLSEAILTAATLSVARPLPENADLALQLQIQANAYPVSTEQQLAEQPEQPAQELPTEKVSTEANASTQESSLELSNLELEMEATEPSVQQQNPLPEERGTLAGNQTQEREGNKSDGVNTTSEVSVTVNASGTDATGLTDNVSEDRISEEAFKTLQSETGKHQQVEASQAGIQALAAQPDSTYHPVFEAPRNSLGKPAYATRPEPSITNGALPTGLLNATPQTAQANTELPADTVLQSTIPPQGIETSVEAALHVSTQASTQPSAEAPVLAAQSGTVKPLFKTQPGHSQATLENTNALASEFDATLETPASALKAAVSSDTSQTSDQNSTGAEAFADALANNATEAKVSVPVSQLSAFGAQIQSVSGTSAAVAATPLTTPDANLPVFSSSANTVADQIVEATQYGVQNGHKSLVLKLNPDNLGEVRLQLNSNAQQQVSAKLIVSNMDAQDALNNQISSLKQSLEGQGLQVGKISVVMAGSSEFGANAGNSQQQQNASAGQDNAQNNWASANQNQQQQGDFNQSAAQQMFNQMMNNANNGGFTGYGNTPNTATTEQQGATLQEETDATWGTPHDQVHENGRVSLLV